MLPPSSASTVTRSSSRTRRADLGGLQPLALVGVETAERPGDRAVDLRVHAHAAMRGVDLDAGVGVRVHARAPVDDAVRARVERDVADLGRERPGERLAEARAALAAQAAPRD